MYKCKFCNEEFERSKIGGHVNNCIKNPHSNSRKGKSYEEIYGQKSIEMKNKISSSIQNRKNSGEWNKTNIKEIERRIKISNSMKKNPNAGGYRQGSGRGNKSWYISPSAGKVFLDSSYELEYAKHLDKCEIKWIRNTKLFPYLWDNKTRQYIPDFYLIKENCYVEIKGYVTEKDKAKWKYFPHQLLILTGKELSELGIL
jgi:hypothetical protein